VTSKRVVRRADPSDKLLCRSCGLLRAFVVETVYEKKNRFGLLVEATHELHYCSQHGRAYASKFNLEIPK